jgi:hypothetical protein
MPEELNILLFILLEAFLLYIIFHRRTKIKKPIIDPSHQFVANTYIGTTMPIKKINIKKKIKAQRKAKKREQKEQQNPKICTEFYPKTINKSEDAKTT